jgi:hypothetical protein
VELVGGLPLAVRIIAAAAADPAMRGQPLAALAMRLEDERSRLSYVEDDERGVRASFDLSYRALPTGVARFFRVLGAMPVPEADIELLAAAANEPINNSRDHATALVNAQLIDTIGPLGQRYRPHDLIRLYANETAIRLESPAVLTEVRGRVVSWYVDAAQRTLDPPSTGHQPSPAALSWFTRERANALTVTQVAFKQATGAERSP